MSKKALKLGRGGDQVVRDPALFTAANKPTQTAPSNGTVTYALKN